MPRIPSKGETVKLICERCYQLFTYTGNGDGTIPTTCPNCKRDSALPVEPTRRGGMGWK